MTYTPSAAPGVAGDDTFTVLVTDPLGARATTEVTFAEDGGTANSYSQTIVLTTAVTAMPTTVSPEGGDHYAFVEGKGQTTEITGKYGSASIDPTTGAITFSPTAGPGSGGVDIFAVQDIDGLGVVTTTTASFDVDGGPAISYEPTLALDQTVTVDPQFNSSAGGAVFALEGASGLVTSVVGTYGTATIDPTTGDLTYAPSVSPGRGGAEFFKVEVTDRFGLTATTNELFIADGGTAATYATAASLGGKSATSTPTLVSPEGGDTFAFANGAASSLTATGAHGTATISAGTGEIVATRRPRPRRLASR